MVNTVLTNGLKGKEKLSARSVTTVEDFKRINKTKHLTKDDIEHLAEDFVLWARDNKLSKEYSLFFNGKMLSYNFNWDTHKYRKVIKQDVNPLKYSEWYNEKCILAIACDGVIYECLNDYRYYKDKRKLERLLRSYGLALICCEACCWEVGFESDGWTAETTDWHKEKIYWLYNYHDANDYGMPEIASIMELWFQLAKETGDKGCCTIGEYMEFLYKGIRYRMAAQSPYQGDYSWSKHVDTIENHLKNLGATEIYMNYGRMD